MMDVNESLSGTPEPLGHGDYEQRCSELTDALRIAHESMLEMEEQLEGITTERDDAVERVQIIEEGIAQLQNGEGELASAFAQFANVDVSPEVEDLEHEIETLRAQLRGVEEELQDSRSTLAREREFTELINQDNEDESQRQAELQQTILRAQNFENENKNLKEERNDLQEQLQETQESLAAIQITNIQLKESLEQEREARHRQDEELEFVNARLAEIESSQMAAQERNEAYAEEIVEIKEHAKLTESQLGEELAQMRSELISSQSALKEAERMLQRYEDEVTELRADASPTSAGNSPVKASDDLSTELKNIEIQSVPLKSLQAEVSRVVQLMRSELPSIPESIDLTGCVTSVVQELRAKEIVRAQIERNMASLSKRVDSSSVTLQERTTLVMKSTKMMERAIDRLAKHSNIEANVRPNETVSEDTLGMRTDDAIERLNKQITGIDIRIDALTQEQKSTVQQINIKNAQVTAQLKADFGRKLKVIEGFGCKYLGFTSVATSRPEQKELWMAIDRIRRENVAPKLIVISSTRRTEHRGQPYVATMYGRTQDGTAVVSKPYATFCSVGQVEMFVIYLCYTREAGSKKRKFYVHALSCTSNDEAEALSAYLIKQCEESHEFRRTITRAAVPVAPEDGSAVDSTVVPQKPVLAKSESDTGKTNTPKIAIVESSQEKAASIPRRTGMAKALAAKLKQAKDLKRSSKDKGKAGDLIINMGSGAGTSSTDLPAKKSKSKDYTPMNWPDDKDKAKKEKKSAAKKEKEAATRKALLAKEAKAAAKRKASIAEKTRKASIAEAKAARKSSLAAESHTLSSSRKSTGGSAPQAPTIMGFGDWISNNI